MKLTYKFLILILGFTFVSCDDLTDINVDPNNSATARPQQVLTSAEGYLSWIVDGRFNEDSYLWAQYWTWGPGVSLGNAARFVAEPDDHNNLWSRVYANALADLKFLTKSEQPAFVGTAKILEAYIYQGMVDHFGDIPFSEAINGEIEDGSNLAPAYDAAASIYPQLVSLVDEGIAQLALASAGDIGAEDLIFGGDLSKWTKFGNSLKLRLLMRQSMTTDQSAAIAATVNAGNFISASDDIAKIDFIGTSGDENPMFATREAGIGNFFVASNASLNVLIALNDPRMAALYDPAVNTGVIGGIDQGAIGLEAFTVVREDYSQGSAVTYGSSVPTILMSPWEVWFLRAEAAARFSTSDDDATAFGNGVSASFDYLGVPNADAYISSLNYGGDEKAKMTNIGTQKWISFNGLQEDEGWIESRRFDTPDNRMFTEGIFQTPYRTALGPGQFPSIWLYPESEQSLNPNSPAQRTITEKIFWDN